MDKSIRYVDCIFYGGEYLYTFEADAGLKLDPDDVVVVMTKRGPALAVYVKEGIKKDKKYQKVIAKIPFKGAQLGWK